LNKIEKDKENYIKFLTSKRFLNMFLAQSGAIFRFSIASKEEIDYNGITTASNELLSRLNQGPKEEYSLLDSLREEMRLLQA